MSNTITWQEALLTVEKLSWTDQLRLVSELLLRMQSRAVESEPIDLLDLAGIGADIWADVDADTYINEERDSWQR
jgi:hypothetical protein